MGSFRAVWVDTVDRCGLFEIVLDKKRLDCGVVWLFMSSCFGKCSRRIGFTGFTYSFGWLIGMRERIFGPPLLFVTGIRI